MTIGSQQNQYLQNGATTKAPQAVKGMVDITIGHLDGALQRVEARLDTLQDRLKPVLSNAPVPDGDERAPPQPPSCSHHEKLQVYEGRLDHLTDQLNAILHRLEV